MARNLADKENVQPADSDYPYGRIKDDSGAGDGTPINEAVYGDFHQFFAKMFAMSGLTYNNLPDSEYSGFQYYEAFSYFTKKYRDVTTITTSGVLSYSAFEKLLINTGTTTGTSLPASTLADGDTLSITLLNSGPDFWELSPSGSDTINGSGASYFLGVGQCMEITLSGTDYVITNIYIPQTSIDVVIVGSGGSAPAFQNSWGFVGTTVKYRINEDGLISLGGIASKATNSTGVIFTLDSTHRPTTAKVIGVTVLQGSTYYSHALLIGTNGDVELATGLAATGTILYLDNINFYQV